MPLVSPSRLIRAAHAEPIPGYRLIEPLGKGGFGEVWKCEAPGGLFKAIKFVAGNDGDLLGNEPNGAEQELRALQHVKSIRHPFLLSMDRVEHIAGELVIVMELADKSLHDLLQERQANGQRGIPREELLSYLGETAEVLDLMNQEYGLQHLDIKPKNLFLVHKHIKVADFGLVNSLAEINRQDHAKFQLGAITPLYAAPETFLGRITLFGDQYSLAIVYCELLTGKIPFAGKNFRQLALQHTSGKPDLQDLPEGDRAVVNKALAKDPRQRYASCQEFVHALLEQPSEGLPEKARDTHHAVADAVDRNTTHDVDLPPPQKQHRTATIARPTKVLVKDAVPSAQRSVSPEPEEAAALDGYHFLDCLGRSTLGELWRVEMPQGTSRLVKLVNTFTQDLRQNDQGNKDATLAWQLRGLRHRGLVPARIIAHTASRIAIVTAPLKDNLGSRLQECQSRGQAGIPRLELLGFLLYAARTLDELHTLYGAQHLCLNPRTLVLDGGQVLISDYGLMSLIWMPSGQQPAQLNPRYASPELFLRRMSRSCDQYSLALIYYELLTGDHVHGNRTPGQLAKIRSACVESLDLLPAPDRRVVGRALHPDPEKRFACCVDFIRALLEITEGGDQLLTMDGFSGIEVKQQKQSGARPIMQKLLAETPEEPERLLAPLFRELTGGRELREFRSASYFCRAGQEIEHHCYARIMPGTLKLKLATLIEQWRLEVVETTTERCLLHMRLQSSLWKRMWGAAPALDLEVRLNPTANSSPSMSEVALFVRPTCCGKDEGLHALEKWGGPLVDSFRTHLQAGPERRKYPRLPFDQRLAVRFVEGNRLGDPIGCEGKDLSREGAGLYVPVKPGTHLVLHLPHPSGQQGIEIPAQVVRTVELADHRYEVGLQFLRREPC